MKNPTTADVAASLNVTENALAKMRLDGSGPRFLKVGRRIRYPQAQYEAWLDSRRYTSTAAATIAKASA